MTWVFWGPSSAYLARAHRINCANSVGLFCAFPDGTVLLYSIYDGLHPIARELDRVPGPGLSITHRYKFLNVFERAIREIYGLSIMTGRVVT